MTIDFNLGETLFVGTLFTGRTIDNKSFSVISTWDTKRWNIDEIVFDSPDDNNEFNRQQVSDYFISQMNK